MAWVISDGQHHADLQCDSGHRFCHPVVNPDWLEALYRWETAGTDNNPRCAPWRHSTTRPPRMPSTTTAVNHRRYNANRRCTSPMTALRSTPGVARAPHQRMPQAPHSTPPKPRLLVVGPLLFHHQPARFPGTVRGRGVSGNRGKQSGGEI